MVNSIDFKNLPIKDLVYSALIITIMSLMIANVYNPLWGGIYIFGNIVVLAFLGWLYQETWSDSNK